MALEAPGTELGSVGPGAREAWLEAPGGPWGMLRDPHLTFDLKTFWHFLWVENSGRKNLFSPE